jgi:hypothetical protein
VVPALLDVLRPAHARALSGLAAQPLTPLPLVDRFLAESSLELREGLTHPHRHDGEGYINYARAVDSACW